MRIWTLAPNVLCLLDGSEELSALTFSAGALSLIAPRLATKLKRGFTELSFHILSLGDSSLKSASAWNQSPGTSLAEISST